MTITFSILCGTGVFLLQGCRWGIARSYLIRVDWFDRQQFFLPLPHLGGKLLALAVLYCDRKLGHQVPILSNSDLW